MSHNQFEIIRGHKDMGEINSLYQIMLLKGLTKLVWVEKNINTRWFSQGFSQINIQLI